MWLCIFKYPKKKSRFHRSEKRDFILIHKTYQVRGCNVSSTLKRETTLLHISLRRKGRATTARFCRIRIVK